MSPTAGAKRLLQQVKKGREMLEMGGGVSEGDLNAWSTSAEQVLVQIYGADAPALRGFRAAKPTPSLSDFKDPRAMAVHRRQNLDNKIKLLESLAESLEEDP